MDSSCSERDPSIISNVTSSGTPSKRYKHDRSLQSSSTSFPSINDGENENDSYSLISFLRRLVHQKYFNYLYADAGVVLALFHSLNNAEKLTILRLQDLSDLVRWEPFIIWQGGDRKSTIKVLNHLRSLRIVTIHQHGSTSSASGSLHKTNPTHSNNNPSSPSSSVVKSQQRNAQTCSNTGAAISTCNSSISGNNKQVNIADIRYQLHPVFQKTLKVLLCKGLSSIPVTQGKLPKHFPTRETLHSHAISHWNHLIQWLIQISLHPDVSFDASSSPPVLLNKDLLTVLKRLNLCDVDVALENINVHISNNVQTNESQHNKSFQWLLNDRRQQVLSLCTEYVKALHYGLFTSTDMDTSVSTNRQQDSPGIPSILTTQTPPSFSNELASRQTLEVLCLLFTLSDVAIGQPCSLGILTVSQKRFIEFAQSIGLVWLYKNIGSKHFFPTPLAKLLQTSSCKAFGFKNEPPLFLSAITFLLAFSFHILSSVSNLTAFLRPLNKIDSEKASDTSSYPFNTPDHCLSIPSELYHSAYSEFFAQEEKKSGEQINQQSRVDEYGIIVESNFKIYTYAPSTSFLPILIGQLSEVQMIMPNMIVSTVSRNSIMKALKEGVNAEQIINFFATHAHPSIYSNAYSSGKPLVPSNVSCQIRIWESERRRVRMTPACLFEFSKDSDLDIFSLAVNRARSGWLLMNSETPSSSNVLSKAFRTWKEELLEKKNSPTKTHNKNLSWPPVLAIHKQYKENLIQYIRNATGIFHHQTNV
ncbi:uncharacterized protein LOC128883406 isoform X2 [Hylaeus volcanicus]|uniref:uncharacterized protein LOC128883406 isoform X2 n=1 Tax=Hylaeus volcanicus TaxID=313075 RepID=UPI0023B7D6AD|nr:uncharacterized protein LOC128883406 isoform X2 [Hylaeus volcanicus]